MPKPLSLDLRKRIVKAYEERNSTQEEIADRFSVGIASVKRYWRLWREKKDVTPSPHGGGMPRKIDEAGEKRLQELVKEKPDRFNQELADLYNQKAKKTVSRSCIVRTLSRLNLTYKKNPLSFPTKNRASRKSQRILSDRGQTAGPRQSCIS